SRLGDGVQIRSDTDSEEDGSKRTIEGEIEQDQTQHSDPDCLRYECELTVPVRPAKIEATSPLIRPSRVHSSFPDRKADAGDAHDSYAGLGGGMGVAQNDPDQDQVNRDNDRILDPEQDAPQRGRPLLHRVE